MTVLKSETFESQGANGTALTTANSIFDVLVQSFTIDNAIQTSGGGSHSGKVTASATTATETASFTATNTAYASFYFLPDVLGTASSSIGQWKTSTGTMLAELRLVSGTALTLRNSGSVAIWTGPTLVAGTKYRINWLYDNTNGQQRCQVFSGANLEGTTPDSGGDSGLVTTTKAGTAARISIGVLNSTTSTLRFDNFTIDNAAFAAPTGTPPNVAPTCNAGTDQTNIEPYSTVTLSGTDSDSDGTISTRAWSGTGFTFLTGQSAATATAKVRGSIAGETLVATYTVTDNGGLQASDTVNITVLPVTERAPIGGVMQPVEVRT